ncbi:Phage regulatory protein CII (CP76) [Pantoea agglomerans]|uniref:Phage regulatory protein CII (CP76) n=1 Tax=Enterobacter agglomerans TaxID=549 RepID=A0A379AI16_ENTAG|nr:Phage regulatory protein CII (CP76) [Pantoea agglomerans]SUB17467.1 Phage regulatory protein CII (CP76) [Pantoea agglomerans]
MRAQTLRNKLNPDQPHQLTVQEVLVLTDVTTLIDGLLAQIQCQEIEEQRGKHLQVKA